MNDIMINKIQSIHRCIKRAKEEYQLAGDHFPQDFSRQDAAILNITRACEQAIDLANVVIKTRKLGIPNESRESFALLAKAALISEALSEKLQRLVGDTWMCRMMTFYEVTISYSRQDGRVGARVSPKLPSSNAACGFPALRFPVVFSFRLSQVSASALASP